MALLFTILVSTPFILTGTLAQPFRRPIDIDISEILPYRVEAIRSTEFPGAYNYAIKQGYADIGVIGRVWDDRKLIIEDDPTALARYVFTAPMGYGMKYVQVLTKGRRNGEPCTHIDEFIRGPGDLHYVPLIRTPIEIDLLSQQSDHYMDVNVIPGMAEASEGQNGYFSDQIVPIHYSIKHLLRLVHTIGVVKYGHHIVDAAAEGLMTREVIWKGTPEEPIIVVSSKYKNGLVTAVTYKLGGEGEFEIVEQKSRPADLIE